MAESLIDELEESIDLFEAARLLKVHHATAWRYATAGTRGVRLRTIRLGCKRVTTRDNVERFLREINQDRGRELDDQDAARRGRDAGSALERMGI